MEVRRQLVESVSPASFTWDLGIDSGPQACLSSALPDESSHWHICCFLYFLLCLTYIGVLMACWSVDHMCVVPKEARRGHWTPGMEVI